MSRSAYISLGGGLDLVTPTRQLSPGAAVAAVNYECPVTGGYRRIDGYAQIGPEVPGEGPILGVATFADRHYAIRKDVGDESASLYFHDAASETWEVAGEGLHPGRYEFDEGNFYATESGAALYGVGGGLPFELTQDGEFQILDSAPPGAQMIALHKDHLFLGFRVGSLQFSNIGDPTGWDADTGGAGEIGVGQSLAGIISGVGGVMHVLCRDSIQSLHFTSAEDSRLDVTVPGAGARRHSAQSLMMPYFVGERGITTLEATQRYGDFSPLHPGRVVEPLFTAANLSDQVIASSVSKSKAQYRVWFSNGTGMYMSASGITQVQYPDQVMVAHAGELSSGEESLLFGDDQGFVYRLDHGNNFNGAPISAFLTLPFTDLQAPSVRKRFRRAFWDVRSGSDARIWVQPDFDYGDSQTGRPRRDPIDFMLGGGLWGQDNWNEFQWSVPMLGEDPVDIDGTGTTINFSIFSESSSPPHELLGYDLHFDARRNRRG